MKTIGQYEDVTRGSTAFPIAFHYVDKNHPCYEMNLHWHADSEIIFIEQGSLELQLNETQTTLNKGDIIYISKNTLHGAVPHDCVYDCIVFNEKTLFKNAPVLYSEAEKFGCCAFRQNRHAIRYISSAILESRRMEQGSIFNIYSNLYALYSELYFAQSIDVGAEGKSTKKIEALKNAIKIIEKEYANPITLNDLANACNMSPRYFCGFFKDMTGHTPFDYLNLYRVEAACELLSQGRYSITDTAFMCGFNDLSYFIKTFKKYKSTSPGKYAAQII